MGCEDLGSVLHRAQVLDACVDAVVLPPVDVAGGCLDGGRLVVIDRFGLQMVEEILMTALS